MSPLFSKSVRISGSNGPRTFGYQVHSNWIKKHRLYRICSFAYYSLSLETNWGLFLISRVINFFHDKFTRRERSLPAWKKLIINLLSQDSITVTKTTLILTGKNQNYLNPNSHLISRGKRIFTNIFYNSQKNFSI